MYRKLFCACFRLPSSGNQTFPNQALPDFRFWEVKTLKRGSKLNNIYPGVLYPRSIYLSGAAGWIRPIRFASSFYEKLDYEILITSAGETSVKIHHRVADRYVSHSKVERSYRRRGIAAVQERLVESLTVSALATMCWTVCENQHTIRNIRAYLLATALYQAPTTIRFLLSRPPSSGLRSINLRVFCVPTWGAFLYPFFSMKEEYNARRKSNP